MTIAYSYSRFSSRAQAKGDSLRRQLASARAYAETHGLTLDTTVRDPGVSGFSGANRTRGALKSFLDRVQRGEIEKGSYLLVDSLDRLSREQVVQATSLLLDLALAGITVVTLNDGRKFDQNANLVDMILSVAEIERSHRESAEKGRKVAAAHKESKRRAREEGRVWHRSGPTWLRFDDRTRKFIPIPAKAHVVRRIFEMIEGGMGTTAIAIRFNAEGVPTPREGKGGWHHSAVLEIAKNRAVIGEYQPKISVAGNRASRRPNDGEAVAGYYGSPIVPLEQFYRVQEIIQSRRPRNGRKSGGKLFNNLFQGMITCKFCGGTVGLQMGQNGSRFKRTSVLRCGNAARGLCEGRSRLPYTVIEQAILRHVEGWNIPGNSTPKVANEKVALARAARDGLAAKVENLLAVIESGDAGIIERYRQRRIELGRSADLGIPEDCEA